MSMVIYESGEELARAFFQAWTDQDLDKFEELFIADADFVNVVGIWWTNRRAIRKAHDYGFRRIFQNARLDLQELKIRALSDEICVIHTVSRLTGQTGQGGSDAGPRVAVITMVAQRFGLDGYRIVSCQNTDRVEGADTQINARDGFRSASYRQ